MPVNSYDFPINVKPIDHAATLKAAFVASAGGADHPLGNGTVGELADAVEAEVHRQRAGSRNCAERLAIAWVNLTSVVE